MRHPPLVGPPHAPPLPWGDAASAGVPPRHAPRAAALSLPALAAALLAAGCAAGLQPDGAPDDDAADDDSAPGDDDSAPDPPGPPVIPGPGDDGFDAELAARALRLDRQFVAVNAAPFGMSLDAYVADIGPIAAWLDTLSGYSREDLEASSGQALYDMVYHYDEMGDLGMFGGVAGLAEVYRYALLRDDPQSVPDDLGAARERFVKVLRALHAMQAMTGRPGSLVRGIGAVDQPGMESESTLPLYDASGNPQPAEKEGSEWREDLSGEFPGWWWLDNTSKDQWDGYVLLLGAAWEVAQADPDIDPAWVLDLEQDAAEMARSLMQPAAETGLDLTLIDGDGRATDFGDLNARQFEEAVLDEPLNAFNALLALGGLKVLAVVSGEADAAAFYEEVAVGRGYAELVRGSGALVNLGWLTNYSNVNMGWVALYSLLRFESDPTLRAAYLDALDSFWAEGTDRAPWHFQGAWFNVIYAAFSDVDDAVVAAAVEDLRGFPVAPYTNDVVINCDDAELAVGQCLGVDGETEISLYGEWVGDTFVPGDARNVTPVATTFVPRAIRPPSNFEWRSDPYRVNGGGGDLLNPGGDFRAAYWAGRFLERGDGLSPRAQGL